MNNGQAGNRSDGSRNALVTGCARQPGAAIARRLKSAGWEVIVTTPHEQDLGEWDDAGYQTARLNMTDPEEPEDVIEQVSKDVGILDALIDAESSRQLGAIEDIPPRLVRRQFEGAVFGLHRLVRAALPHMREAGEGRIVTVTGLAGQIRPPGRGVEASSQVAGEVLLDALRGEVQSHGLEVITIQSGPIDGAIQEEQTDAFEQSAAYEDLYRLHEEVGLLAGVTATSAEDIANVVHQAVTCADPAPRYPVGKLAATARWARFLPDSVRNRLYRVLRRVS